MAPLRGSLLSWFSLPLSSHSLSLQPPPLPLLLDHLSQAMFHFLLASCLLACFLHLLSRPQFPIWKWVSLYLAPSAPPLAFQKNSVSFFMVCFLYNLDKSFCSNLLNRKSNYFSPSLFLMRKDWFPGTRSLERLLLQDKKISFDSIFYLFPSPSLLLFSISLTATKTQLMPFIFLKKVKLKVANSVVPHSL